MQECVIEVLLFVVVVIDGEVEFVLVVVVGDVVEFFDIDVDQFVWGGGFVMVCGWFVYLKVGVLIDVCE